MKRKKNKVKSLNLRNPKQMDVINLFAVSEGRVSRQDIVSVGNKEILYRMLNLGYIKETVNGSGIYKATPKLKSFTQAAIGKSYSNGCSNKHSRTMSKVATTVIPKTVLTEGRFAGQNEIKSRMDSFKASNHYSRGLQTMRNQVKSDYSSCKKRYESSTNYQQRLDSRKDLNSAEMRLNVINSDNPCFTPDMEITITRAEAEQMLQTVRELEESSDGREHSLMCQNEEKLEQMLSGTSETFTVGVEIVTENYCNEELYRHQVYEILTGEQVLYFC